MWKSNSGTMLPDYNLEPPEGKGPMGYNCHKCGEWFPENQMIRFDREKDTVYYCVDCWKEVPDGHD